MRISVDATDEEIMLAAKLIENKVKFSHIARTNIDELVVFINVSSDGISTGYQKQNLDLFLTEWPFDHPSVPMFIRNCPVSFVHFHNDEYESIHSDNGENKVASHFQTLVLTESGEPVSDFVENIEISPTKITVYLKNNEHGVALARILPRDAFARAIEIVVPEPNVQLGSHAHIVLGHAKEVNDLSHIIYETRFFNNLALNLGSFGYGKTSWKRTKKGNIKFYYENGNKTLELPKQLKGLKIKVKHGSTPGAIVDSNAGAEQDSQKTVSMDSFFKAIGTSSNSEVFSKVKPQNNEEAEILDSAIALAKRWAKLSN